MTEIQDLGAILGGLAADFDHLAGVELVPVPSVVNQVIGGGHLHVPLGDIAIFILHIEENERMRLNELKVRYGSRQRRQRGIVIGRGA
jgi:hypothetical protein